MTAVARTVHTRQLVGLAAAMVAALISVPVSADAGHPTSAPLPLGPVGLLETRSVREVAPGVRFTIISRGTPDPADAYTVHLSTRLVRVDADADTVAARSLGATDPELLTLSRPDDDRRPGPYAYVVRDGGRYPSSPEASLRAAVYQQAGFRSAKVVHTSEDGLTAGHVDTGPWVVQMLEVDQRRAFVTSVLATDMADGAEQPSSMVARTKAVAGVNGDFFVNAAGRGQIGDVAGLSIVDGAFTSESIGSQPVLAVRGGKAPFEELRSLMTITAGDGSGATVRGWDRAVGTIEACGGSGGATPTDEPRHDTACSSSDDIVVFDERWSIGPTPSGTGTEVTVGADGRVVSVDPVRGRYVPAGGLVIAGIGAGATWLEQHAAVGETIRTAVRHVGPSGAAVGLPRAAVGGGPLLLRDGQRVVRGVADGFAYDANPEFWHRFGLRRNNRTLAGRRRDGTIVLITIDGRMPGMSIGATFDEEVAILQWAGAVDGMNLDGGGSTTMVIGDGAGGAAVTNHPTDATGERAVGNAIVVLTR